MEKRSRIVKRAHACIRRIKAAVSTTERKIEGDATRKKISERGHLMHRAENQEGRHLASGQLLLSAASTEKRSNALISARFYASRK